MDCEVCTDRMVELLYSELPEAEAEATRAHLDDCETCAEAYGRVSTGHELASMLELVDPPASVLDSVMAAAREKAADLAPAQEPEAPAQRATPPRDDDEHEGLLGSLLHWVGGFAMRPQMAMAMTLLLMVGLGMWYLPTLRQSDPADSHAIVDPAPGDEVGPSASLAPAEPLDLQTDPATGRIRPRADMDSEPRIAERPRPTQPEVIETEEPLTETPTEEQELAAADEGQMPDSPATPGEVIEDPLPDPRIAETVLDVAPGEPLAATESQRPSAPSTQARVPAMATQQTQTAPMPSPAPQPSAPRSAESAERYERGLQRMRERNYRGAADDFEDVIRRPDTDARRLLPSALHHLARSQSAAGNCRAAVSTFERLLSQHARYSGGPEAMIEAATCYRRMGRISEARRLLERARTQPSVAARARRELTVLAERERAMDRQSGAAAAEPADVPASTAH